MARKGFSLLELSIVLVIIGLLAGGVMVGQDLVRQAEIRTIATDFQKFMTARNAFKNKYSALPGDFRQATSYWGRQINAAHCVTNVAAAVASTGVCDGNGDSILIDSAMAGGQSAEAFQFWRHLAKAGMIEGDYSGLAGSANGVNYDFGVNSPSSRVSGAGWSATLYDNSSGGSIWVWRQNYINWLTVGTNDGMYADDIFMAPSEAYAIDMKLDDGKPGMGIVHALEAISGCHTGTSITDYQANYALSASGNRCALMFKP